jgi:hypothetical protein
LTYHGGPFEAIFELGFFSFHGALSLSLAAEERERERERERGTKSGMDQGDMCRPMNLFMGGQ